MSQSDKIRVAVLYGGRSAEHEVSCRSAENVIQYLDKSLFEVIPIGIDKQGNWLIGREIFHKSLQNHIVAKLATEDAWFTPEWVGKPAKQQIINFLQHKNDQAFDVVFPVVHGAFCEDGTLQGLLELANVAYVGCGVLPSAIGMDKDVSKRLAQQAGIKVAPFITLKQDTWNECNSDYIKEIQDVLGLPIFVKPANTGSSIGISKVKTQEGLSTAIDIAFRYDTRVVIEKALNVIELEAAILETLTPCSEPMVSKLGEVRPRGKHEFYSYDAKYIDKEGADLIIPAQIPEYAAEQARQVAKHIFSLLECESMVRVDLFFNKDDTQIYFNEINTLPGFTKTSMYPKLMEESGMLYPQLLTHLVQLAINRFNKKSKLARNYVSPCLSAETP